MKRRAILSVLLTSGLSIAFGAPAGRDPGGSTLREGVRAYRAAHEAAIVEELAGLLALPNVASDGPNIEKNAEAIEAALRRRGVRTELLRVPGAPPVVYGELDSPGARRTVILYAHYDGQPVVASQWASDPWKPVLREKPLEEGGREVPAVPGRRSPACWLLSHEDRTTDDQTVAYCPDRSCLVRRCARRELRFACVVQQRSVIASAARWQAPRPRPEWFWLLREKLRER